MKFPVGRFLIGMTCILGPMVLLSDANLLERPDDMLPLSWGLGSFVVAPVYAAWMFWWFGWVIGGRAHANKMVVDMGRSIRSVPLATFWLVRRIFTGHREYDDRDWLDRTLFGKKENSRVRVTVVRNKGNLAWFRRYEISAAWIILGILLVGFGAVLVTNRIQHGSFWEFHPREEMDFNDRPDYP